MAPLLLATLALAMAAICTAAALPPSAEGSRIVGGVEAKLGELPSTVALVEGGQRSGGGILIGPKLVLTAAHCAYNTSMDFKIRAGALLTCREEVSESPTISYAKLPKRESDPTAKSKVTTAGWGRIAIDEEASVTLRRVTVSVVDRSTCRAAYQKLNLPVTENMVCAAEPGKDSCSGDSGGPLYDDATKDLVGVVSWGFQCAEPGFPGVYVRVGKYIEWIAKNNKAPQ
ncbi:hypothetical protein LOZ12_006076 [Ophidiomyces ophidiicola]|uniref:uncharacterized protein n=1 Tax=Ophidiomyces ophidiicola TaxID=1387563 RepID=UPI0020C262C6|nr:uncharacterized protein LOZ57_006563 [Ophidiomyces ophidiicola]KAI1908806.1 hypothetical protein LOZ64_005462 [Ophidiomyces ophidiicola]KAI1934738.1 hypothetical protein LOZ62_006188 [Ophidiomyces ophidiicola]KAI1937782.1 hypothetical protein LOZ57_006563 [Ophidiomyces ophidiicola]KAI1952361.1 hypothetical protein LOZ59_005440 [Ophidiomyces ophidiicola]KAI1969218.1 hypothetical protein LOZ56_004637 [Ophidiomyces ophidiicola]